MIGNFERMEIEFVNTWDGETKERTATTTEEMHRIGDEFNEVYALREGWTIHKIGIVKCDCGKEVEVSGFTTPCECGADYNFSGTRLAPRAQWGEETGEHWTDCY